MLSRAFVCGVGSVVWYVGECVWMDGWVDDYVHGVCVRACGLVRACGWVCARVGLKK